MDASDMAVIGAGSALIGRDQVRRLILRAQSAWRAQCALGLCDDTFDAWRHGALYDAVRKTSFRAVTQREFGVALGHFIRLSGGSETAYRNDRRIAGRESSGEGDRRRAMAAIYSACQGAADVLGSGAHAYALSLLDKIHGVTAEQATARQIWQVIFTIRNRAAAKRRKK